MNDAPVSPDTGREMYGWAKTLFPKHRSLAGPGIRDTLTFLKSLMPGLTIHAVPSGTKAFDWTVPDEWTINEAYVSDGSGRRVADFGRNFLHVVGYSEPVDRTMTLEELQPHLHSLPEQPDAIPFVTSYYKRTWGFCLAHRERQALKPGSYRVVIDSEVKPGVMNFGELILPGSGSREVLLSTYICHPGMANNELSGPVMAAALARWLSAKTDRRHRYRILFMPETIGAIHYLSRHLEQLRQSVIAGFVLTCCGDEAPYTFMPSRLGGTLADRVARQVLHHSGRPHQTASFLDRGSDERQYCNPGVDLPVVSIMRSMYGRYPEYHTSKDDLSFISPNGLQSTFEILTRCLQTLEANHVYRTTVLCEPQLGPRGLYPTLSNAETAATVRDILNVIAYADGSNDLVAIAEKTALDPLKCHRMAETLVAAGVMERVTDAAG
jgi:aminopeptidase-like protein